MDRVDAVNGFIGGIDTKFFKVFTEPARLEILKTLMIAGKSDIKGIADRLPQDRSVISRHLAFMEERGVVTSERDGRHTYYFVNAQTFVRAFEALSREATCCMDACCGGHQGRPGCS